MIKLMRDLPDYILGVLATEKITGADYITILIPALEEKLKTHPKIRVLYHIKSDFIGFELSALWDDAKLGMKHLWGWERIALVSDHEMVNSFVMFFGHLLTCQIRIYRDTELEQAKEWIAAL